MFTQNVNLACFACNVEWDFFCDFQTLLITNNNFHILETLLTILYLWVTTQVSKVSKKAAAFLQLLLLQKNMSIKKAVCFFFPQSRVTWFSQITLPARYVMQNWSLINVYTNHFSILWFMNDQASPTSQSYYYGGRLCSNFKRLVGRGLFIKSKNGLYKRWSVTAWSEKIKSP